MSSRPRTTPAAGDMATPSTRRIQLPLLLEIMTPVPLGQALRVPVQALQEIQTLRGLVPLARVPLAQAHQGRHLPTLMSPLTPTVTTIRSTMVTRGPTALMLMIARRLQARVPLTIQDLALPRAPVEDHHRRVDLLRVDPTPVHPTPVDRLRVDPPPPPTNRVDTTTTPTNHRQGIHQPITPGTPTLTEPTFLRTLRLVTTTLTKQHGAILDGM
jgi:hypothetical protein